MFYTISTVYVWPIAFDYLSVYSWLYGISVYKSLPLNMKKWWIVYLLFSFVLKVELLVVTLNNIKFIIISCRNFNFLLLHISFHSGNADYCLSRNYKYNFIEVLLFLLFLTGKSGWAAPRLKDAALSLDKLREGYVEVCQIIIHNSI